MNDEQKAEISAKAAKAITRLMEKRITKVEREVAMSYAVEAIWDIIDDLGLRDLVTANLSLNVKASDEGRCRYPWHLLRVKGDKFLVNGSKEDCQKAQKSIASAANKRFGPGAVKTKITRLGLWVFLK